MNVRLLRKVKKHILEEPRCFLMADYVLKKTDRRPTFTDDAGNDHEFAQCGTAACIGGWAMLIDNPNARYGQMTGETLERRAAKLLGLDTRFHTRWHSAATRLFHVTNWPTRFAARFLNATSQEQLVEIAAERIEHFIATKGAE